MIRLGAADGCVTHPRSVQRIAGNTRTAAIAGVCGRRPWTGRASACTRARTCSRGELAGVPDSKPGSGVPTVGNVYEVAKDLAPSARVVYVDIDPVAIAHARHLLTETDGVRAILADMRKPQDVLTHPLVLEALDLAQPVVLLFNAVLHFLSDADRPGGVVRAYVEAVAPGSYIALSHAASDLTHRDEQDAMLTDYRRSTSAPFTNREPEEIARWLGGLEICPRGWSP